MKGTRFADEQIVAALQDAEVTSVVALAAKSIRILWSLLAHDGEYKPTISASFKSLQ